MGDEMVDVTLHIDENLDPSDRESLRDKILSYRGVAAADYRNDRPHLMIIEYNPAEADSSEFISLAREQGYHAELIGL